MKILAQPIAMISKTLENGNIVPVKFRIKESEEFVQIRVDKVLSAEETKYGGVRAIIYSCQSEIGGILKRYELKYRVDRHTWELYKM